jgi:hypothetical protein
MTMGTVLNQAMVTERVTGIRLVKATQWAKVPYLLARKGDSHIRKRRTWPL